VRVSPLAAVPAPPKERPAATTELAVQHSPLRGSN
jgi:hypothetical protein